MSFADPHTCPSCGGPIAGEDRCPTCRFRLNSPEASRLWQTLLVADKLLTEAQRVSDDTAAPAQSPLIPTDKPMPRVSRPAETVPRRAKLSTGSVILGLGALFLIVAAIVFISVSWDVLGASGRTIVLLVITGAIAGIAIWSTRHTLRASAEAMWTVFFGFFTIDYFAARSYGLLGLDALDGEHAVLVFGVVVAALGGTVAVIGRKHLALHAPSVIGGLAVWVATIALAGVIDAPFFWRAIAGLALAGAAAVIAGFLSLRLLMLVAGAAAGAFFVAAVIGAAIELAEHPHLDQLVGHGSPMLLMSVLTVIVGLAVPRLRTPAGALATLGLASLVFAPSIAASTPDGGYVAAAMISVVLALGLIRGSGDWITGVRISAGLVLSGLTLASFGWIGSAVDSVSRQGDHMFERDWTTRLVRGSEQPESAWLALVVFAAIAASLVALMRWPEGRMYAKPLNLLPVFVAALGVGLAVISAQPPAVVAAASVLGLGAGLLILTRSVHAVWQALALVVALLPAVMALSSETASLGLWVVEALVLAAVAILWADEWLRRASAFACSALVVGSVALIADLSGLGDTGIRLAVLIASIVAVAKGSFLLRRFVGRIEIEVAGGLGIALVLLTAVDEGLGTQALLWTVAGASLVLISLFVADRRWLRLVGSAGLGVAWVLRLLASDVSTVEAYTAPFAVVLLGAGLWAMRGDEGLRTVIALTPGLSLALLPSIPQALADPTGLRALLLGIAALTALAAGVRQKWQMPFAYGSAVLALLVVWNVGPVANGLPRWLLIAAAGAIFTGIGITWENRVGNARSIAQYVQNLR